MNNDIAILKALASEYAEAAADPHNAKTAELYRSLNGLKMKRPVVLIDEEPLNELNTDGELNLQCSDVFYHEAEHYMRKMLYKWRHYRADMILTPYIPVYKIIGGDWGQPAVKEETVATDNSNYIISHEYEDQLANPEDIEILRIPRLTYEKAATEAKAARLNEAIGDIIPVRITGHNSYLCPWDDIARYRGVTNLLLDLADRPEHTHAIIERVTQQYIERMRQFEELNLLEAEPYLIHCTAALCDELKTKEGEPVLLKNVWGRSMAQIFSSVSSEMHEEFDTEYQKRMMAPFGLVYYGCCEPLDKKIDIVEKIPHLRKISVTPWADINIAAEAIGKKYVVAIKPNPANVGVGFDRDVVKQEITNLLDACSRNGCNCEITLKDISTVNHWPKNLQIWENIVMDIMNNY